jgi:mono/diheme cytochrome c family protein
MTLALLLAAEMLLPGDARNAQKLYRLHCSGCHAANGEPAGAGKSLGAPMLRDPALIAARNDDQLMTMLLSGTPRHPAPGRALKLLDAADLVALLRQGLPGIADLYPDAAAYTAKTYTLQGPAVVRAEVLTGDDLKPEEKSLTVFAVYAGEVPLTGPRLVPQDPVALDELSPKAKRGYVVFGWYGGAPVAMSLAPDFAVARLLSPNPQVAKAAPAVVGKGGKTSGPRKAFVSKAAPDAAKALTRLYARASEAAAMAAREEADRHLFDAPEKR